MKRTGSQRQQAGAGSQQFQIAGDLILGITEERAVEIAKEQSRIAIQEFTAEAAVEANARMDSFDEKVVNDLSARGLLESFADPAFQILLRKTQLHAASTSVEADYELLAKLMVERAEKPSKPIHMIISRAVEVVEQIDSEALVGLMFVWFVISVGPSPADPKAGLAAIDGLIAKLLDGEQLPSGLGWAKRLGLMNCIGYNPMGVVFQAGMNKWQTIAMNERPGYICEGIMPEDVDAIRVKLDRVIPNLSSVVVEHPFLPGRFRINALSSTQLLNALRLPLDTIQQIKEQIPQQALLGLPIQSFIQVLGAENELQDILTEARLDTVSAEATDNMLKYIESELPNLQKLRLWWDSLNGIIEITPIGSAIAYSNAKRLDPLTGLPSLSEIVGYS